MNRWILRASVLFLACNLSLACGDDDDDGDTTGGSAGEGGDGASSSSGGQGEGGTPEPGSGGGGGAPEPVTCEAPTPPDVGGGEGGAGGGAAGGGGAAAVAEGLAIIGSYTDDFDGEYGITNATWTNFGVYNISQFDNKEHYVIARNDEGNASNPCAWSRFDWTVDGGDLYFCQSAFAAESEQDALEVEPADPENLEHGCGSDFAWSLLTPQ